MSAELRKQFYERFARQANEAGISWAVLSGIEGYPAGIGRDLDVACESAREADRLCNTFSACLREEGFRWIVYPSPIWGRRILGITDSYAAVELHIVDPVRVGGISLSPAWKALDYEGGVFPTDPLLRFFKRCLMPALAGGASWRSKCAQVPPPPTLPWWMRETAERVRSGRDLTRIDRMNLFARYFLSSPIAATANLVRWRVRHGVQRNYPAAPVYHLNGTITSEDFLALAERSLREVFTGFVCVDGRSPMRVKLSQSAQRLAFLSTARTDIDDVRAIPKDIASEGKLLAFVVEEFARFNERWRPDAGR